MKYKKCKHVNRKMMKIKFTSFFKNWGKMH